MALTFDLKPTMGVVFIGLLFASVFYGVTLLQTLLYFRKYPNDKVVFKCLVVFIWILDTLDLIFVAHGVYVWLVIDFANPFALIKASWSILAEPITTATIALSVHLFMSYRIWILDRRLFWLASAITVLSFLPFGMGIASASLGLASQNEFLTLQKRVRWMTIVAISTTAALDVIIATTLCLQLYLQNRNNSFRKTSKMIYLMTTYFIASNLLTSILTLTTLIVYFASPSTLLFECLNVMISKAYTNTFLGQLNARESILQHRSNSSPNASNSFPRIPKEKPGVTFSIERKQFSDQYNLSTMDTAFTNNSDC